MRNKKAKVPHDEVARNLTDAMKNIDFAVFKIHQKSDCGKYKQEADALVDCTRKIHKVLIDYYDKLATYGHCR